MLFVAVVPILLFLVVSIFFMDCNPLLITGDVIDTRKYMANRGEEEKVEGGKRKENGGEMEEEGGKRRG